MATNPTLQALDTHTLVSQTRRATAPAQRERDLSDPHKAVQFQAGPGEQLAATSDGTAPSPVLHALDPSTRSLHSHTHRATQPGQTGQTPRRLCNSSSSMMGSSSSCSLLSATVWTWVLSSSTMLLAAELCSLSMPPSSVSISSLMRASSAGRFCKTPQAHDTQVLQ